MSQILFSGCTVQARLPFIEAAARHVIASVGADVPDMDGAGCCMEPVGLRSIDPAGWENAMSDISSGADGRTVLTVCEGCNLSLTEGGCDTAGFLEFLTENLGRIREGVVSPSDLTVAVFPGCHADSAYSRRGRSAQKMMSDILSAVGCDVRLPEGNLCCGGGVSGIDDALSKRILAEAVDSFRGTGCDAVVTSCPFCFMQFDLVARMPVYHVAEMVAKAMGWEADLTQYHRS